MDGDQSCSPQPPPAAHPLIAPERWVVRWSRMLHAEAEVLDVACGRGRHARWLAAAGHRVTAVDRDADALAEFAGTPGVTTARHDLEGAPWPFPGRRFDAVVVVHYLHRPLFASLLEALRPGGVLVYETFAEGNERFGRPTSAAFLLREGELLARVAGRLRVVAYEQGEIVEPRHAVVQRLCAVGPAYHWPWPLLC